MKKLAFIVALFIASLAGCASGTDALRQACAGANDVLSGGYRATTAASNVERADIEKRLSAGEPVDKVRAAVEPKLEAIRKALAALDVASDASAAVCVMPDMIDAGQKGDISVLVAQLATMLGPVTAAIHDIAPLLAAPGGG